MDDTGGAFGPEEERRGLSPRRSGDDAATRDAEPLGGRTIASGPAISPPSRPTWRQRLRVAATGVATVVLAGSGAAVAPRADRVPEAASGHAVLLTNTLGVQGVIQVVASNSRPDGVSATTAGIPPRAEWVTIEVDEPAFYSHTHEIPRRWALLLEGVPRLSFAEGDATLHTQDRITELQPPPRYTRLTFPQSGSHYYLVSLVGTGTYAAFTFAAPAFALNERSGYTSIAFPSVSTAGTLFTSTNIGASNLLSPTTAFVNVPSTAPRDPVEPQSVANLLDFPTTDTPDDLAGVAGEGPTSENGNEWDWTGGAGAHELLRDTNSQNHDERDLFWAGLLLGAAGAAAISFLLELVDVVAVFRRNRANDAPRIAEGG
jgi:hypothetical protein